MDPPSFIGNTVSKNISKIHMKFYDSLTQFTNLHETVTNLSLIYEEAGVVNVNFGSFKEISNLTYTAQVR